MLRVVSTQLDYGTVRGESKMDVLALTYIYFCALPHFLF